MALAREALLQLLRDPASDEHDLFVPKTPQRYEACNSLVINSAKQDWRALSNDIGMRLVGAEVDFNIPSVSSDRVREVQIKLIVVGHPNSGTLEQCRAGGAPQS